jgi:hypothetical protein
MTSTDLGGLTTQPTGALGEVHCLIERCRVTAPQRLPCSIRFHDPAEPAAHHRGDSLVWPTGRGSVRCSVTATGLRRRPRKIVHRPRLGECLASLLSGYGDPTGRAPDPAINYVVISDEAAMSPPRSSRFNAESPC